MLNYHFVTYIHLHVHIAMRFVLLFRKAKAILCYFGEKTSYRPKV